jgi:mono/diheme cytochrome c family protein
MRLRLRVGLTFAVVAAAIYTASIVFAAGADTTPARKTAPKQRDGAELYQINCARCHVERYPTERTDAQWKTIMLHMRTRAQIPARDARAILKYLQENN